LAAAIVLAFVIGKFTHAIKVTSLVGFILAGVILGPLLGIIHLPDAASGLIVNITLAFVAFIIGMGFTRRFIRNTGPEVVKITIIESLVTAMVVFLAIYLATGNLPLAIILAVLAPATAPAGTIAALRECRARGRFGKVVMGIVGMDDAVAVTIFVGGLLAVRIILGGGFSFIDLLGTMYIEIVVAVALGVAFGLFLSFATKRLHNPVEIYTAAVGAVILCGGIADILGASLILACIVTGMVFVNTAQASSRVVRSRLDALTPVLFVVFFVTAGLELKPGVLLTMGLIGGIYVTGRMVGKFFGASMGSRVAKSRKSVRNYLGFALLSQAGVAIGLALLVGHELRGISGGEELGTIAVTIVMATTVVFEIIGPLGVKFAVSKTQVRPKTDQERLLARLKRTAEEIDIFDSRIDEDICVYEDGHIEPGPCHNVDTLVYSVDHPANKPNVKRL